MKANLENISSRIQQEAEQVCREAVVDWKKSLQAELQPFHDIFDESDFKYYQLLLNLQINYN